MAILRTARIAAPAAAVPNARLWLLENTRRTGSVQRHVVGRGRREALSLRVSHGQSAQQGTHLGDLALLLLRGRTAVSRCGERSVVAVGVLLLIRVAIFLIGALFLLDDGVLGHREEALLVVAVQQVVQRGAVLLRG